MYNEKIEGLIKAALADGELTEKEKQILFRKAEEQGVDLDEFEMVLDARLVELQKSNNEVAPKSNKLGDIRKCPQCGTMIGSFQMVCPECGFEFSGIGPNKFVEKFALELRNVTSKAENNSSSLLDIVDTTGNYKEKRQTKAIIKAEINLVKNYPMPMTKEDCIEMLNFMLPRVSFSGSNGATRTWRNKFNAILAKLERSSQGNKKAEELVAYYKEQTKISGLKNFLLWYKSLSGGTKTVFWVVLLYAVFGILGGMLLSSSLDETKGIDEVQKLIEEGSIEKAKIEVRKGAHSQPLYDYYIQHKMWEDAEEFIPQEEYPYGAKDGYFKHLKRVVTSMCEDGKYKEARKYIKRKVVFYEEYNDKNSAYYKEWNTVIVSKKLNAIVDNY